MRADHNVHHIAKSGLILPSIFCIPTAGGVYGTPMRQESGSRWLRLALKASHSARDEADHGTESRRRSIAAGGASSPSGALPRWSSRQHSAWALSSAWLYNDDLGETALDHIAKVKIEGTITEDEDLLERLEDIRKSPAVKGVISPSPARATVGAKDGESVRQAGGRKARRGRGRHPGCSAGYMIA